MNERLRELRKFKGLTLEQFGEKVGLKKSALSSIENGKIAVTDRLVMMVVKEFGVSESWLRTGEGDMFPPLSDYDQIAAIANKMLRSIDDTERRYIVDFLYNRMNDDEVHVLLTRIIEFVDGLKEIREPQS